ncbi:hypothetical protein HX881_19445 [Pseudomonas gingeri]|uniref:hypothetical protein n=1 Tax=Pseudomonas TaxID=286 RepID=UPI0015A3748D|nr:hypothetical protein [Pseudomonas gingeri]NVZ27737.1 hypothetical protein [Pseudomonas gingeri]NWE46613.1 hypothetical protein [Pseudomonas gingeri]NWE70447.1 hypothetical protein [Pseudomonas gingeri]
MLRSVLVISVLLALSGCGLFQQTAKPSEITLVKAMEDVGAGLKAMHDKQEGMTTGLIPASVDVTFNIAASDKKGGNLTIDLSKSITGDVARSQSLGGGLTSSVESSRGNTVTVRFINLMTVPKETIAYTRSPADIELLFKALPGGPQYMIEQTQGARNR